MAEFGIIVGLIVFATISILIFVCWACEFYKTPDDSRRNRATTNAAAVAASPRSGDLGLDSDAIASLPVFVCVPMAIDDKLECAVCLAEFKVGEKGRLLPRCGHSFHADCIDMWFGSHSTCPLCRVAVEFESADLQAV